MALCSAWLGCQVDPPRVYRQPASAKHLRAIAEALDAYCIRHGQLPYHDRGSDAALYLVAGEVDQDAFGTGDEDLKCGAPVVDHDAKSIRCCAWEYLNALPTGDVRRPRVYLVSRERNSVGTAWIALGPNAFPSPDADRTVWYALGADVRPWPCPDDTPTQKLLGSWLAGNAMLAVSEEIAIDWERTHPPRQQVDSTWETVGGQERLLEEVGRETGWHYKYSYTEHGALARCEISDPGGSRTIEAFQFDQLGRLTSIERNVEAIPAREE